MSKSGEEQGGGLRLGGISAWITGAGSGIGRDTARLFAREGAFVTVCDRDASSADAVAHEIEVGGGRAIAVVADVSRSDEVEASLRTAEREGGGVHVLFNNAGVFPADDGSPVDTPEAVWEQVIDINLKGVFLGCKHGIPALLRAGGGSIINTASFVAVVGAATSQIAYTASKGGVLAMTREIAVEYARQGIRANALCPGPVNTPLLQQLLADPEARARRFVHLPMGRLAESGEIAQAALFLASSESSYVSGSTFLVDGGLTAAYVTPED